MTNKARMTIESNEVLILVVTRQVTFISGCVVSGALKLSDVKRLG